MADDDAPWGWLYDAKTGKRVRAATQNEYLLVQRGEHLQVGGKYVYVAGRGQQIGPRELMDKAVTLADIAGLTLADIAKAVCPECQGDGDLVTYSKDGGEPQKACWSCFNASKDKGGDHAVAEVAKAAAPASYTCVYPPRLEEPPSGRSTPLPGDAVQVRPYDRGDGTIALPDIGRLLAHVGDSTGGASAGHYYSPTTGAIETAPLSEMDRVHEHEKADESEHPDLRIVPMDVNDAKHTGRSVILRNGEVLGSLDPVTVGTTPLFRVTLGDESHTFTDRNAALDFIHSLTGSVSKAYDPGEPRDQTGEWTAGGGSSAAPKKPDLGDVSGFNDAATWKLFSRPLYEMAGGSAKMVPLSDIVSDVPESHFQEHAWDSRERASDLMRASLAGRAPSRAPLYATKGPDGKYHLVDGNSTYSVLKASSVKNVPIIDVGEHNGAKYAEVVDKSNAVIKQARKDLPQFLATLKREFGHDNVDGRAKTLESATQKLWVRGYQQELSDAIGTRIQGENMADVEAIADRIKKVFGDSIVQEKNMLAEPEDGYRAIHFKVRTPSGALAEIQVRTAHESRWANWVHDTLYKTPPGDVGPATKAKRWLVKKYKHVFVDYANKMSDYYYALDRGLKAAKPACPVLVSLTLGCLW